jgi:hypothetical protein
MWQYLCIGVLILLVIIMYLKMPKPPTKHLPHMFAPCTTVVLHPTVTLKIRPVLNGNLLTVGHRVLLAGQIDATKNGIYVLDRANNLMKAKEMSRPHHIPPFGCVMVQRCYWGMRSLETTFNPQQFPALEVKPLIEFAPHRSVLTTTGWWRPPVHLLKYAATHPLPTPNDVGEYEYRIEGLKDLYMGYIYVDDKEKSIIHCLDEICMNIKVSWEQRECYTDPNQVYRVSWHNRYVTFY